MPGMNGLEETRVLKKLMPAVPVIIFTAHIDPFVEKEARAAGVSAVVSKSEAVAALITKARGLLDQIAATSGFSRHRCRTTIPRVFRWNSAIVSTSSAYCRSN
jgi:DNA-binding NarL/FixJ family response regulator